MLVESKMAPIYSYNTGSLEGTKCRVPNNVEAPALCAAGTFSTKYAKCIVSSKKLKLILFQLTL